MTPTQHLASLGRAAIALIDDYDQEDQVIFGRETHFTEEQRNRLIAEELRKLVALHRQVVGS